jgi:hypothetical protein
LQRLIVDAYNDFMSEGGKLYEATKKATDSVGFYDLETRRLRWRSMGSAIHRR